MSLRSLRDLINENLICPICCSWFDHQTHSALLCRNEHATCLSCLKAIKRSTNSSRLLDVNNVTRCSYCRVPYKFPTFDRKFRSRTLCSLSILIRKKYKLYHAEVARLKRTISQLKRAKKIVTDQRPEKDCHVAVLSPPESPDDQALNEVSTSPATIPLVSVSSLPSTSAAASSILPSTSAAASPILVNSIEFSPPLPSIEIFLSGSPLAVEEVTLEESDEDAVA